MATPTLDEQELISRLEGRRKALIALRGSLDNMWDDLARFIHPARVGFTHLTTPGEQRTKHIVNSTALTAREQLASTVESMLLPKDRQWGFAQAADPALRENDAVKRWFDEANRLTHEAIYSAEAQFEQSIGELIEDVVTFGTGVMFMAERANLEGMFFRTLFLRNVYLGQNAEGKVDLVAMLLPLTVDQAITRFDQSKFGNSVQGKIKDAKFDDKIDIIVVVMPANETTRAIIGEPLSGDRPFVYFAYELSDKVIVDRKGFDEMPFITPRWKTIPMEVYGFSPGRQALPDVKMVNAMDVTLLKSGQLKTQPPLLIPDDGFINVGNVIPGGTVPYDAQVALKMGRIPVQALDVGGQLSVGGALLERKEQAIRDAFFTDVLKLPDKNRMTATEVLEHRGTFVRLLGSAFGRLLNEINRAVYVRAFGIELRAGRLPSTDGLPAEAAGAEIGYKFFSAVQEGQRMAEVARAMRVLESLAPAMQIEPEVKDNFDLDQVVRDLGEAFGPMRWIRPTGVDPSVPVPTVREIREARAEQLRRQQEADQANQEAEALKTGTEAVGNLVALQGGGA
jgi:hypothetical protein